MKNTLVAEIGLVYCIETDNDGLVKMGVMIGGEYTGISVEIIWGGAIPQCGDLIGVSRNRHGEVIKAWELPE